MRPSGPVKVPFRSVCGDEPVCALLKCAFFVIVPAFSNMVAVRAKVDGKWQAKFQRRLRYRVTGLRPSGLPNLPFSVFLSFPPFSSASLLFPILSPIFPLFTRSPPPFFFCPAIFHHLLLSSSRCEKGPFNKCVTVFNTFARVSNIVLRFLASKLRNPSRTERPTLARCNFGPPALIFYFWAKSNNKKKQNK